MFAQDKKRLFHAPWNEFVTSWLGHGVPIIKYEDLLTDTAGTLFKAIEQVSGVDLVFDQEGIKDEEETVASRSGGVPTDAILEISSVPEGAEIEIEGAFAGTKPRTKRLSPGEYKIKITKSGYKSWERKIQVAAQEEIPLAVELERK